MHILLDGRPLDWYGLSATDGVLAIEAPDLAVAYQSAPGMAGSHDVTLDDPLGCAYPGLRRIALGVVTVGEDDEMMDARRRLGSLIGRSSNAVLPGAAGAVARPRHDQGLGRTHARTMPRGLRHHDRDGRIPAHHGPRPASRAQGRRESPARHRQPSGMAGPDAHDLPRRLGPVDQGRARPHHRHPARPPRCRPAQACWSTARRRRRAPTGPSPRSASTPTTSPCCRA